MASKILPFCETIASRKNMVDCFIISLGPAYSTGGVIASLENISLMIFCEERHFLGGHYVPLRDWVKEEFIEPAIGFPHISVNFIKLPVIRTMLRFFLPGCNSLL